MIPDLDGKYSIPGFSPKMVKTGLDEYCVKYKKANMDDEGDMLELQALQTRSLRDPEDIMILSEDMKDFMGTFFIIVKYLEKTSRA